MPDELNLEVRAGSSLLWCGKLRMPPASAHDAYTRITPPFGGMFRVPSDVFNIEGHSPLPVERYSVLR